MSSDTTIDVCICTYRRESLADTLRSIAAQQLPDGVRLRVIVADNDDAPSAQPIIERAREEFGLECRYVQAPARNISIARNACVDAADAPLMAFLDDDEVATPTWLAELVGAWRQTGAAVLFGPVVAVYGNGPAWLRRADLHSIRPAFLADGSIDTGYACNVLIDRAALGGVLGACRFDPALGRSGGEDTEFFAALHRAGARLAYCATAVVHESVPPHRARLPWLLKRFFRSGQTFARVRRQQMSAPLLLALASGKAVCCLAGAALQAGSAAGWRRWLVRCALHAGVAARCMGLRDLQLY